MNFMIPLFAAENFSCLYDCKIENPNKISIFIPGLGVNLFGSTETEAMSDPVKYSYQDILPKECGSFFLELQDYNPQDNRVSYPLRFEEQAIRIQKVLLTIMNKFPVSEINITAQSVGCLAIIPMIHFLKSSNLPLHNLALWGPPTFEKNKHSELLSNAFAKREGTKINLNGESVLQCKNQKTLIVGNEYWDSLEKNILSNNLQKISGLFSSVLLFIASQDKLYPNGNSYYKNLMAKNCVLIDIHGESHTFQELGMQRELRKFMRQYYLK